VSKRLMGRLDEDCAGYSCIQLRSWPFLYCAPAVLPGLLLGSWRICGHGPQGLLLEEISKSDSVAHPTFLSLALLQVVVWLTEGSGVMRRDRKEWCCDAKQALPGSL